MNSGEFTEFIRDQKVESDEEVVSFDVVSLFTSIPIDLALQVIESKLEIDLTWQGNTKLTKNQVVDLTKLCFTTATVISRTKDRFTSRRLDALWAPL